MYFEWKNISRALYYITFSCDDISVILHQFPVRKSLAMVGRKICCLTGRDLAEPASGRGIHLLGRLVGEMKGEAAQRGHGASFDCFYWNTQVLLADSIDNFTCRSQYFMALHWGAYQVNEVKVKGSSCKKDKLNKKKIRDPINWTATKLMLNSVDSTHTNNKGQWKNAEFLLFCTLRGCFFFIKTFDVS